MAYIQSQTDGLKDTCSRTQTDQTEKNRRKEREMTDGQIYNWTDIQRDIKTNAQTDGNEIG